MIKITTETWTDADITGGSLMGVGPLTDGLPSVHKVMLRVSLSGFAQPETRTLTVRVGNVGGTIKYAIFTTVIETTGAGQSFDLNLGPFMADRAGVGLYLESDNANDTAVTIVLDVYSDDIEYYLTWRDAETLAAADSITGRTKATDDAVGHADYGLAKLVRSTTPANTLDVSATGEAGLDFANVKDATGPHTLANITVPAVTTAGAVTGAVGSVTGPVGSVTGAVGSVTAGVTLADGAIAAAKIAASALNGKGDWNTVTPDAAGTAAGLHATTDGKIDAILEDTGTTIPATLTDMAGATFDTATDSLEKIRNRGDAAWLSQVGAGAITFTYTVTDAATGLPIDAVEVWASPDIGGSPVVASGTTNGSGQVVFYLDAGTYYIWRSKAGWNFVNPDTEVVS